MNFFKDHLNLSNNIYDNAKILKSVQINKQQELVNRNPIAKYYQTIALNLQEQVQYLTRRLNEVNHRVPTVVQFGTADNMSAEDLMAFGGPTRYVNPKHTDYASQDPHWNGVGGIIWRRIRDAIIEYIRNNPREAIGDLIGLLGGPWGLVIDLIANAPGIIKLISIAHGIEQQALMALLHRLENGTASQQEIQTWQTIKYMLTSYYHGGYIPVNPNRINPGPTSSPRPDWANQGGNN